MEEGYVEVDGIRTRYLEAGRGEALLLVHGGHFGMSVNANDWDLNIKGFAENFHVVAFDKVGCGLTDNPKRDEDYVIGTMVQHAYEFLKAMKIKELHAVGHSRGGYVVTRLALEHPELVKRLVIVDSGTLMTPPNPIYNEWDRQSALIEDIRERQRYRAAANSFGNGHITEEFVTMRVKVETSSKTRVAVKKMEAGLKIRFEEDLIAEQKKTHGWIQEGGIKAPTLIIWGADDPSAKLDPVGFAAMRLLFSSIPRCQMHIFNRAGHCSFREHPDAFVAVVTAFIRSFRVP